MSQPERPVNASASSEAADQAGSRDPAVVEASSAEPGQAAADDQPAGTGAAGERPAAGREQRLPTILESLLFAADHPLSAHDLAALVDETDVSKIDTALRELEREWAGRGVQLHPVAGGWQLRTHPSSAVWVQRLVAQKPVRLTRLQLESLAIIAYRQPITRPEIDEIRGVDTGGTLRALLERALVRILGKKEEPGRPLLYGTTREFLEFFNLRDLRELPTLREFLELSDEHRAQVEALERAAPPGSVEADPGALPPLARVELSDDPVDEDLGQVEQLIGQADARARAAAAALGSALPDSAPREVPSGVAPGEPDGDAGGD